MRRLILFDVDGTLIARGDPDHLAAIDFGVHTVFPETTGASVHQVDYDGKVDRAIASEVLGLSGMGIAPEDPRLDRVFDLATSSYRDRWEGRGGGGRDLLPGVRDLIELLVRQSDAFALGVVTGGSQGIVRVKLGRLGLAESLPTGAFGNEVSNRPALVELALQRASAHYGETFDADRVVVVGDTPHDVHCAHAHQIACLAVATGKYSVETLREAGADDVVASFEDAKAVVSILERLRRS